ncbi:MAG: coniferyl aldehyde dehydrogenase [Maricaulaceae bacterium]|nr:coniferyl aldehyde dehydrogenase [Maricaulaceae bacterium]
MSDADTKQIERMKAILKAQQDAFAAERHRAAEERRADLKKIADLTRTHADDIAKAISEDFGVRSAAETQLAEVAFVIKSATHAGKHLKRWMKSRGVAVEMTMAPGKAYVRREPKGVAGIVSPWNYPYQLALAPLVAALAAGCRAMIKPSEYTPKTAELIKRILGEAFDETHVAVITGGPAVGEAFCRLPFDHLFYTGSTSVGRLVAKAAAENLTPVTLELGGKSPAILTEGYPLEPAAKSIAWGKYFNAGQTCVAPDYLLVPAGQEKAVGEAVITMAAAHYPQPADDPHYTSIVSDRHHARLKAMIEQARAAGAEVIEVPHDVNAAGAARKIPPTVVIDPPLDSDLMREEIFGPVLPVLGYDSLAGAVAFVNGRERPLALYVYAKDKAAARSVLDRTLSGGACVNAAMLHLSVEELPFGGVGASGQGAYHGEHGFLTFSHQRAVFEAPVKHPSRMLAPPYGAAFRFISKMLTR